MADGLQVVTGTSGLDAIRWPDGIDEIRQTFGDPAPFYLNAGERVTDEWPSGILTRLDLPAPLRLSWQPSTLVRRISCHHMVAPSLGAILAGLFDAGLWQELQPFGGVYAWRPQRGGSRLSTHCWGAAIDVRVREDNMLGMRGTMPAAVVECFEAAGAVWGGHWMRPDPVHFQFCTGL